MKTNPYLRLVGVSALALGTLCGCEMLSGDARMPSVTFKDAALVQSPSQSMLSAYYCPEVVPNPFGIPGSAATLCSGFFGSAPSEQKMQIAFRTNYGIDNPNAFPLPVAELLTAVTVFPEKTQQSLGASCVVFCDEGDTSCTGEPGPDSCKATSSDIRSVQDFAQASANLLVSQGVQLALGEKPGFHQPKVLPGGESTVSAVFSFGTQPLLSTLEQLALQSVDQLTAGEEVVFEVPFRIEGTVWLDVGSLGRVAVGYGPVEGSWVIPTEMLTPDF